MRSSCLVLQGRDPADSLLFSMRGSSSLDMPHKGLPGRATCDRKGRERQNATTWASKQPVELVGRLSNPTFRDVIRRLLDRSSRPADSDEPGPARFFG
jgi:hypothetical protein